MNATLFDDLCNAYPNVAPYIIVELLNAAENYVAGIRFHLPENVKHTVLTLCCLKSLDRGHAWAYEDALLTLLVCHAKEQPNA